MFDVHVRPCAVGAYSRVTQNELALRLYQAGVFDPARSEPALTALSMMDFEGKEQVLREVQKRAAETADKLKLAAPPPEAAEARLTQGAQADLKKAAQSKITANAHERAEVKLA